MEYEKQKINYLSLIITVGLHLVLLVSFALLQFSKGGLGKLMNNPAFVAVRELEVFQIGDFMINKPSVKRTGYGQTGIGKSELGMGLSGRVDGSGLGQGSGLGDLLGDGLSGGSTGEGGAGEGGGQSGASGGGLLSSGGGQGGMGQNTGQSGTGTGTGGGEGDGQGDGTGSSGGSSGGGGYKKGGSYKVSGPRMSGFIGDIADITEERPETKSHKITFFGNVASARKVCFVVDCSGSMLGFFGEVQQKLTEVVESLKQDNFYGIIVFRGSDVIELEKGKLIRASDNGKEAGVSMISSIPVPMGKPDALEAVKAAIRYKDSIGDHAGVIYFLTDGFDYAGFPEEVERYRKEYAPVVKIHTIGFRTNKRDAVMLQKIAENSGGEFTLYSTGVN